MMPGFRLAALGQAWRQASRSASLVGGGRLVFIAMIARNVGRVVAYTASPEYVLGVIAAQLEDLLA